MRPTIKYNRPLESFGEAIANSVTHGFGALLSVSALVILIIYSSIDNNTLKIVSSIIYGSSLVAMYSASTLYHSLRSLRLKHYLRILDHSTIYLLIAGSYTPFLLITLHGPWGWSLFGVVWSIAIAGIVFKLFFVHRFELLSTFLYLAMGWLVVIAAKPLWEALPGTALIWLALGGLSYTGGVVFYVWKRPFSHTIWHLFVLAGSAFHFVGVFYYVIM